MIEVRQTEAFSEWLKRLADIRAKAKIADRSLGPWQSRRRRPRWRRCEELRIHYGPGYRVYFVARGRAVVILLCGGDKSSQAKDIKTAKQLARDLEV